MTENRLQQEAFIWFHNHFPELRGLYFEIHNNSFSAQSGMKHKAIGRIAGVADNCFLNPYGIPVFFEFKSEKGKLSIPQKNWSLLISSFGYKYFVIYNLQEFQEHILNYVKEYYHD